MRTTDLTQFPIPENRVNFLIGQVAAKEVFFQKKPSESQLQKLGIDWFQENIHLIEKYLEDNPLIVEFFSVKNERRNDILAITADVILGIPILTLLSKISHYGVQKLTPKNQQGHGNKENPDHVH